MVELADRVSGRRETYAQLVRLVHPDLKRDKKYPLMFGGGHRRALRWWDNAPEEGPYTLETVWSCTLRDGGEDYLLLDIRYDPGDDTLALYRLGRRIELLDAVAVVGPLGCDISGDAPMDLGGGHQAFELSGAYSNTGDSMVQIRVVGIVNHQLRVLLEPPSAIGERFFVGTVEWRVDEQLEVMAIDSWTHGARDLRLSFHRSIEYHPDQNHWDHNIVVIQSLDRQAVATWDPAFQSYRTLESDQVAVGTVCDVAGYSRGRDSLYLDTGTHMLAVECDEKNNPRLGEIWWIRYRSNFVRNELISGHTTGRTDGAATAALVLLADHYRKLQQHHYQGAYDQLSSAWRGTQSFQDFVKGYTGVQASGKTDAAVLQDMDVKVLRISNDCVVLLTQARTWVSHGTGCWQFTVVRQGGRWVIDRCTPLPDTEWFKEVSVW